MKWDSKWATDGDAWCNGSNKVSNEHEHNACTHTIIQSQAL